MLHDGPASTLRAGKAPLMVSLSNHGQLRARVEGLTLSGLVHHSGLLAASSPVRKPPKLLAACVALRPSFRP
jgi:hypothetical protein